MDPFVERDVRFASLGSAAGIHPNSAPSVWDGHSLLEVADRMPCTHPGGIGEREDHLPRGAEVALEYPTQPTAEHTMSRTPAVLLQFDEAVAARGSPWRAIAFGVETPLRQWEGWLEFTGGEGQVVATDRETTQPNRTDLDYWATGLSHVYLEGALQRALARNSASETADVAGASTRKAPGPRRARSASREGRKGATEVRRNPVLDPFAVYAQGEDVLRKELHALSPDHLETIVDAYDLEAVHSFAADWPDRATEGLIAGIMAAVTHRASVPNK